ncbi:MAG: WbqC family protein [Candidatus Electrothrix communis]|nr:MAG: WbqC family protein [Candidatus Electrothrix communis]
MKKTVVIHQPDFAPYLGFFHRLLHADLYVVLDHVQFVNGTSRAWTHRDKIKTANGEKWLSLSVNKVPRDTAINQIELSKKVDWRTNNLRLLQEAYRKAPFFDEIYSEVEQLYQNSEEMLCQFNLKVIEWLFEVFDLLVPMVLSSQLNVVGSKNELLVDILQKVEANCYLSGVGAGDYFNSKPFDNAGIEVLWQDFTHPEYPQMYGEFIPYMSCLDLLFNCGVSRSRKLLREI